MALYREVQVATVEVESFEELDVVREGESFSRDVCHPHVASQARRCTAEQMAVSADGALKRIANDPDDADVPGSEPTPQPIGIATAGVTHKTDASNVDRRDVEPLQ